MLPIRAIAVNAGYVELTSTKFESNSAKQKAGAVYIDNNSYIKFNKGIVFKNNVEEDSTVPEQVVILLLVVAFLGSSNDQFGKTKPCRIFYQLPKIYHLLKTMVRQEEVSILSEESGQKRRS